jgi:hypothetical protein
MTKNLRCTDCRGELELGYIPDVTYGFVHQAAWHEGDPKAKKGIFERLTSGAGAKFDRNYMTPITAYRCAQCGLIKLYAVPKTPRG